jgi:hypothetical protein
MTDGRIGRHRERSRSRLIGTQPAPLVLLVQMHDSPAPHADMLQQAGFRVHITDIGHVERDALTLAPALIAVELAAMRCADVLEIAGRVRAAGRARDIPVIVYANCLDADAIEQAARARLLSVQIGASDQLKLLAAIRGVLAARAAADASIGLFDDECA